MSLAALALLLATGTVPAGPVHPSAALGQDEATPPDATGAATAEPDRWPRDDAAAAGLDDMIRDERHFIRRALPSARRGDDPNGPPADERILRTLRKVGGDSVIVPVLTMPFGRAR